MVDNNEQWNDIEYSEDELDENQDFDSSDDADEDEYEDDYGYDDDDEDDYASKVKSNSGGGLAFLVVVLALLIAGVSFAVMQFNKMRGNTSSENTNMPKEELVVEDKNLSGTENLNQSQSENDVNNESVSKTDEKVNSFFNDSNENNMVSFEFGNENETDVVQNKDNVATKISDNDVKTSSDIFSGASNKVASVGDKQEDVTFTYGKSSRSNPFKPMGFGFDSDSSLDGQNDLLGENDAVNNLAKEKELVQGSKFLQQILAEKEIEKKKEIAKAIAKERETARKAIADAYASGKIVKAPDYDNKKQSQEDAKLLANVPYEIIEPPETMQSDPKLNDLMSTQISGILYDVESPSAIVKINGQDTFVKAGDVVSGYKIDKITKNQVQISYENNTYVASVGQLFTKGALEAKPAVDNLNNKFGGRYKINN